MNQPHRIVSPTAGFSLVELLLAVSVIALLAGLLLPVVSTVRDSARSLRCTNNLRQMGIANASYAQDNRGSLVPIYRTGSTNLGSAAAPQYGSAWNNQWIDNPEFLELLDPRNTSGQLTEATRCPSSYQRTTVTRLSYGLNRSAPGYAPDGGWNGSVGDNLYRRGNWLAAPRMGQVAPGAMMFTDAVDWVIRDWNYDSWTMASEVAGGWQANSYRHRNRGNVVRFDGSAIAIRRGSDQANKNKPEGALLWLGVSP